MTLINGYVREARERREKREKTYSADEVIKDWG